MAWDLAAPTLDVHAWAGLNSEPGFVGPKDVRYGEALPAVLDKYTADGALDDDWLEAVTRSGYSTTSIEGVRLALIACHLSWLHWIKDAEVNGSPGDAIGQCKVAACYRELAALCEALAIEMDRCAVRLWTDEPDARSNRAAARRRIEVGAKSRAETLADALA